VGVAVVRVTPVLVGMLAAAAAKEMMVVLAAVASVAAAASGVDEVEEEIVDVRREVLGWKRVGVANVLDAMVELT